MNTNAKLLACALSVVAVVATPAMAKTHHRQANHNEIGRAVFPAASAGAFGYESGDRASDQALGGIYHSFSQGSQPYPNPDRVPLNATTEPF